MKTTALLPIAAMAILFIAACQEPCPEPEQHWEHPVLSISPDIDTNTAIVQSYLNGIITADEEAIGNATAENFISYGQRVPLDSATVDEVVEGWQKNDSTRSNEKIETIAVSCERVAAGNKYEGDWVHYWGRYSATDNATGKHYEVPFFSNTLMKNFKMVKSYVYFDRLSVFHQLGIDPPGAEGEEEEAAEEGEE